MLYENVNGKNKKWIVFHPKRMDRTLAFESEKPDIL